MPIPCYINAMRGGKAGLRRVSLDPSHMPLAVISHECKLTSIIAVPVSLMSVFTYIYIFVCLCCICLSVFLSLSF